MTIKTYDDAAQWLASHGIETQRRSAWLRGSLVDGTRTYEFTVGRSSAGGNEISVKLLPDGLVSWFRRDSLQAVAELVVEARDDAAAGRAPTWLDALIAKGVGLGRE